MAKVDTAMQANEQESNLLESNMLELTAQSSPAPVEDQAVVLAILREMEVPRDLYPLVSVTFKMTAAKKNRMQRLSEKWELTYSELLRLSIERVVDVLESPSGEVLDILQAHRAAVIERRKAQAEREMQLKTPSREPASAATLGLSRRDDDWLTFLPRSGALPQR